MLNALLAHISGHNSDEKKASGEYSFPLPDTLRNNWINLTLNNPRAIETMEVVQPVSVRKEIITGEDDWYDFEVTIKEVSLRSQLPEQRGIYKDLTLDVAMTSGINPGKTTVEIRQTDGKRVKINLRDDASLGEAIFATIEAKHNKPQ